MLDPSPPLYQVYWALSSAISPFLELALKGRQVLATTMSSGSSIVSRQQQQHLQRWGYASHPRPPGTLMWLHAVSLGESMAALPLIRHCHNVCPHIRILITTATPAAWDVLQERLPTGVICQYVPVDAPGAVERFLEHWHPDAGVFVESELWPNLIMASRQRNIPLALLNARMSETSFQRWNSWAPIRTLAASLASSFTLILPLNTREAVRFQLLGASPAAVRFAGDLKLASVDDDNGNDDDDDDDDDVDDDDDALERQGRIGTHGKEEEEKELLLKRMMDGRSVWVAASTHRGEEQVVAHVHKEVRRRVPALLTVLVPRHVERGSEIEAMLGREGLVASRRSRGEAITKHTDVYVADTLGELALLYRLAAVAFVGGSMFPGMEGHNLAEAAAAGCAVLTGPHLGHFSSMLKDLNSHAQHQQQQLAVEQVSSFPEAEGLSVAVGALLTDVDLLLQRQRAATVAVRTMAAGIVARTWDLIRAFLLLPQVHVDQIKKKKKSPHPPAPPKQSAIYYRH